MPGCHRQPSHHVVVVDGHEDSRDMYIAYFTWAGVAVTAVSTGTEALRVAAVQAPDVVITCLRLPDTDGFGLRDALRAKPSAGRLPVIALSTCIRDHQRALRDCGYAAVLMKPCRLEILLGSLRRAVGRGQRDRGI